MKRIFYLIFAALILIFLMDSFAQVKVKKTNTAKATKESQVFPDEYSELDEVPVPTGTKDKAVMKTLEQSRQKYLQALILIEKGDTSSAAKNFEEAINILNKLVNYPNIEQNDDFTDLAQSIIEDYESFIQSIDKLDENSSLFIIRDKLFQEMESGKNTKNTNPQIKALTIVRDTVAFKKDTAKNDSDVYQIPLDDNDLVQKNITFLTTGKPRKVFQKWYERSTKWFPLLKQEAKAEGLPEEIIYLAMIESGLNPMAVSKAKAVGMWQFIRSTGELYGLNKNGSVWLDERRDPEKATRAAMKHLKDLYNDLGHWHLALAAYNCGANGVKRAIAKSKLDNPNFWELRPYLPKETRNYVPQYIAAAKISLNPEKYGFKKSDMDFMPEYKYESYSLKEPLSIKALAKCANLTPEEFIIFNPELISTCTPPDVTEYNVKLPVGARQSFIATLATLSPEEKQPWVEHKVEKGESVRSLADIYGVSEQQILSANNMENSRVKLRKGTVVRIPIDQKEYLAIKEKQKSQPDDEEEEPEPAKQAEKSLPTPSTDLNKKTEFITHSVAAGETLQDIANRYGVRLSDLRNYNNIPYDDDKIEAGTVLKISPNSPNTSEAPKQPGTTNLKSGSPIIVRHKVREGETLAQIADNYSVSIDQIKETNKIKKQLYAGQVLKIETEAVARPKLKNVKPERREKQYVEQLSQKKVTHKVKKGENLGLIAAKYGVSESQLKKWNPKAISGSKVLYGTKLKIYQEESSKGSSGANGKKVNKVPKNYVVKKGDTLEEIADKFGVSVKSLKKLNKGINNKTLQKGKKIRIQ